MPRTFAYDIEDMTGGLNESAPEMIRDSEFAQLDNWYVRGPSLWQREGYTLVAGEYSEGILSVFLYDPDSSVAGDEIVILGCRSTLAKVVGTGIEALTIADGRIYPDSGYRWWGTQYNDEFFICRRGSGGVKRIYGSSVMEAGIAAPTTPPLVNDGGVGKKTAGVYQLAVRYLNSLTGAKSNWSPMSQAFTIVENHQLYVSSVPVSSNPQVNARQIGATQPDGAILYLVGQIDNNVDTTFYDNALSPDGYGEADVDVNGNVVTDTRHGVPPSRAWALERHKERLFVLNKLGLFWSEPAYFQSFKATSYIPVVRGTGIMSWDQHGLVILTEKEGQMLEGDTPGEWRINLFSKEHGSPAGKSMAIGDGTLFWYTGVTLVASSGGAPGILPGIERIQDTLDSIPEADKADVIGETVPSRGWYVLSVPTDEGRKVIIFDYKTSRFVGVIPDGPLVLARLLRENATEERMYAAFDDVDNLYDFWSGTTDDGVPITATFLTKNFGYETQGMLKAVRRIGVKCKRTNGTLTLRVYHDGNLVATRSGLSLNGTDGWHRFTMRTSGRPGTLVQIGGEYSGTVQARIERLQIEGVLIVGRRPKPV